MGGGLDEETNRPVPSWGRPVAMVTDGERPAGVGFGARKRKCGAGSLSGWQCAVARGEAQGSHAGGTAGKSGRRAGGQLATGVGTTGSGQVDTRGMAENKGCTGGHRGADREMAAGAPREERRRARGAQGGIMWWVGSEPGGNPGRRGAPTARAITAKGWGRRRRREGAGGDPQRSGRSEGRYPECDTVASAWQTEGHDRGNTQSIGGHRAAEG